MAAKPENTDPSATAFADAAMAATGRGPLTDEEVAADMKREFVRRYNENTGAFEYVEAPPANKHVGLYTKRARMVREGDIGITIRGTEYVMPISEAWELIALIYRAKHDGVQP